MAELRHLGLFRSIKLAWRKAWRGSNIYGSDANAIRQQAQHLSHRLPTVYLIFVLNAALVGATLIPSTGFIAGILGPAVFSLICLARAHYWLPSRVKSRSIAQLRTDIDRLKIIGPTIVLTGMGWASAQYLTATPLQQGVLLYVVGATTVSGVLTLVNAPKTAVLGGIAALIPFASVLFYSGEPVLFLIAICHLFVTLLLTKIAVRHYVELQRILRSSVELKKRQFIIQKNAAELETLSSIDPLTRVWNRRTILSKADQEIADLSKPSPWLALLDLDGFKEINDKYGHAAGDTALQNIAERIAQCDEITNFGRIGGDEFAIILSGRFSSDHALQIMNELAEAIAAPLNIAELELRVRASIGLRKTERLTLSECLERADFALFEAKEREDPVVLFDHSHEARLIERSRIAADFREANLSQALEIEFQPIYDFDEYRVVAVEALARWKRDDASVVMPHIFIELAESSGRIAEITDNIIAKALEHAATWPDGIDVQINLSAQDLQRSSLLSIVSTALAKTGVAPRRVIFELTESIILETRSEASRTMEALRSIGCRIALDDFGTGYSSLAYVDRFPIDQIKLDREFARKLSDARPSTAVCSTVLSLSQQLGASCTIEGIETQRQALVARSLGFRRMQGFHFSRPVNHAVLSALLRQSSTTQSNAYLKSSNAIA